MTLLTIISAFTDSLSSRRTRDGTVRTGTIPGVAFFVVLRFFFCLLLLLGLFFAVSDFVLYCFGFCPLLFVTLSLAVSDFVFCSWGLYFQVLAPWRVVSSFASTRSSAPASGPTPPLMLLPPFPPPPSFLLSKAIGLGLVVEYASPV